MTWKQNQQTIGSLLLGLCRSRRHLNIGAAVKSRSAEAESAGRDNASSGSRPRVKSKRMPCAKASHIPHQEAEGCVLYSVGVKPLSLSTNAEAEWSLADCVQSGLLEPNITLQTCTLLVVSAGASHAAGRGAASGQQMGPSGGSDGRPAAWLEHSNRSTRATVASASDTPLASEGDWPDWVAGRFA